MPVLYLTEDDVRSLASMDLALEAVESAFRKLSLDEAVNLPRQRCQTDHVMLHVLPAAAKTLNGLGFKAYTTTRSAAKFHLFLYDSRVGGLTAILEADYLGQLRTGAASGVATKKLARADAETVGLFGTGRQARTQLEAVCRVRPIRLVHVFSRDEARRQEFARVMSERCQTQVIAVASPAEAAINCDIVITATTSREPVLHGEWLSPGCHLNLIGSNFLAKAEADIEVFRKANLVTIDSKDQGRLEAGDFVAALREGVLNWATIWEFPHVLVGRYPGRQSSSDITVFKSLGLGIEDVALGVRIVELARQQSVGQEISLG
jgi:alanine dehydrogenase